MSLLAGARNVLTALYQSIEARLASRQALISLQGRLELLAAQPQPGAAAGPASAFPKPQVGSGGTTLLVF